jgi:hypothetical protein
MTGFDVLGESLQRKDFPTPSIAWNRCSVRVSRAASGSPCLVRFPRLAVVALMRIEPDGGEALTHSDIRGAADAYIGPHPGLTQGHYLRPVTVAGGVGPSRAGHPGWGPSSPLCGRGIPF